MQPSNLWSTAPVYSNKYTLNASHMLVKRASQTRQVAGWSHFINNQIGNSKRAQSELCFPGTERVLKNGVCLLERIEFLRWWKCSEIGCGDGGLAPQMYLKTSESNVQCINCASEKLLSILKEYLGKSGSRRFKRTVDVGTVNPMINPRHRLT